MSKPRTVLDEIAEMWEEKLPPHQVNRLGTRIHEWDDDARWFAGAFARILRNNGHEMASDFLREVSMDESEAR